MRQPSPSRAAVVAGLLGLRAELHERGREQHVAAGDLREDRLLGIGSVRARSAARPTPASGSPEAAHVGADLAQHHAEVEEPEAEAAGRFGQRDAEQVRLRELLPCRQVVPVVGRSRP